MLIFSTKISQMNSGYLTTEELNKIEKMAEMFKMLAHPYKLTIFKHLCDCGFKRMQVKQIYSSLGIQQATASRHLNALKKHELLKRIVEKGKVYYIPNIENEIVNCISQCFIKLEN